MSYSEIMIQAYAEAKGITREEAFRYFVGHDHLPAEKKLPVQTRDPKLQELLNDLGKDRAGVIAWRKKATE